MKQRQIPWSYALLHPKHLGYFALAAISLLLSCEKKKEIICTETCCDPYATRYKYVTEIRDADADYANGGFWLKNPINGVNGIGVCNLILGQGSWFKKHF